MSETTDHDAPVSGQAAETPEGLSANIRAAADRREQTLLRLSLLNTIIAVAGVFTGAIALYAALTESEAVRKQSAAAVWPFVQFTFENRTIAEDRFFSMSLTNAGVGPAKVESLLVRIDGIHFSSWQELAAHATGGSDPVDLTQNFIVGRVLRPGQEITLMETRTPELVRFLEQAAQDEANRMAYCFCSIFDDCWLSDSAADLAEPEPVRACPSFGDDAFGVGGE